MTKEEAIRRKKVMQDAGIRVPNVNGSWGPWWEELWQKAITHLKDYGKPNFPKFIGYLYDILTNNTTYKAEPLPKSGTITSSNTLPTNNEVTLDLKAKNYWHPILGVKDRFQSSIDNETNPLIGLSRTIVPAVEGALFFTGAGALGKGVRLAIKLAPTVIPKLVTKKGVTKAAEAVVRETPRIIGSIIGGEAIDLGSKTITGNTWSENMSKHINDIYGINIPTYVTTVTNPGYVGGYKLIDRGIKRASFNLITPLGYVDEMAPLNKLQEGIEIIKDIPKQIFNFKDIKVPKWRLRFEAQPGYSQSESMMPGISNKDLLDNRETALRLVFNMKPNTALYLKNPDGTYRYNLDYLYLQGSPGLELKGFDSTGKAVYEYTPKIVDHPSGTNVYIDNLGFNGGIISYSNKNGISHITDVYDVNPFHDLWRLPGVSYHNENIITSSKMGNFSLWMNKHLPDFEVFNALWGKPFTLKQSLIKE